LYKLAGSAHVRESFRFRVGRCTESRRSWGRRRRKRSNLVVIGVAVSFFEVAVKEVFGSSQVEVGLG
jgi:hypothetical protein